MDLDLDATTFQRIFAAAARSPTGKISSWRVLARFLVEAAGGFDRLVKLMVLEGAAGVPPMSWAGKGRADKEIEKHLGPEAVNLLKKGPNVYTEVKRAVERFLPSGASVTADDLMQQAIMGLNINNEQTRDYLFYAVGKRMPKDKITKGTLDWKSDVAGVAKGFVKNRVRDVMNKLKKERARTAPSTVRTDEGYKERELPSFADLSKQNQMGIALRLLSDRSNSGFRKIQDWMARKIKEHGKKRKSDETIFLALLDNIERGSPKSESAVAKEIGISGAAVSQAKKRIGKFLADELAKNERILAPIWHAMEMAQLGFGESPLGALGIPKKRAHLNPETLVALFLVRPTHSQPHVL